MKRVSASGVHTTRGDYRSVGIERVEVFQIVDGHILRWRHPLYHRWETILERAAWKTPSAMKNAKTGPYYAGCTVCDEWLDFSNFARWALANGFKPELEIDRIDNERGYSPDNCRWVTHSVQMRNRRMTEKMLAANRRNVAKARAVLAAKRAAAKRQPSNYQTIKLSNYQTFKLRGGAQ